MKEKIVDELLEYFIKEDKRLNVSIPDDYEDKRMLLRGIINIREPKAISEEILNLEDKLLELELKDKNIINAIDLDNKVSLYQGDITCIKCDAIVNACNEYLLGCFIPNHSCIDNQIHTYSGIRLRLKCNEIMNGNILNNGKVVLTDSYNLPCKYVIHTVGPQVYGSITKDNETDLKNCYINLLDISKKNNIRTIVFPCISTGVYGYPKEDAASIAYNTVVDYLKDNSKYFDKVVFNVFTDEDRGIYERLFKN